MKISFDGKITADVEPINNETAKAICKSLPIKANAQVWGDEIYFNTGIEASSDGATLDVSVGDVAYWPQGKCLCIFFGPTPLSPGKKPVPASEVVLIGKTTLSPDELRKIPSGAKVLVE